MKKDKTAPRAILPRKRTMLDFILWYNRIELKEVQATSEVSYTTLHKLMDGHPQQFGKRTLKAVADSVGISITDFYDTENQTHKYYGDT